MKPFTIAVGDDVLDDLRQRLDRVRWAEDFANPNWEYGTNGDYLKKLVEYWRSGYDWRRHERDMNAFPHFLTEIDGMRIHYMHIKGKGPKPMPLLLNHGWPWTFWDFQKLIGPLTDPAAHGGVAEDAFDLVIPSLPGYGYSTPLTRPGINFSATADLWVKLMQRLGYPRFATQGGDWGAIVSAQLGHKYANRLYGVHIHLMTPLDIFTGGAVSPDDYAESERAWLQKNQGFFQGEAGYYALQTTKPQTIAFALNDSPVGLCSWLLEKRRTWSDCQGDVEARFSKDDLLTSVMLYWVTQSFGTSARYYYEAAHQPWRPSHNRMPVVEAPTGVAVFHHEVMLQPRRWAERYYNLQRWTECERGGHFAAMEEPRVLVGELREFFRPLRASS